LCYLDFAMLSGLKKRKKSNPHLFFQCRSLLSYEWVNILFGDFNERQTTLRRTQIQITLTSNFVSDQGGDLQNFLQKFLIFFVTLSLKILRLFRLKVLFEADIIEG